MNNMEKPKGCLVEDFESLFPLMPVLAHCWKHSLGFHSPHTILLRRNEQVKRCLLRYMGN